MLDQNTIKGLSTKTLLLIHAAMISEGADKSDEIERHKAAIAELEHEIRQHRNAIADIEQGNSVASLIALTTDQLYQDGFTTEQLGDAAQRINETFDNIIADPADEALHGHQGADHHGGSPNGQRPTSGPQPPAAPTRPPFQESREIRDERREPGGILPPRTREPVTVEPKPQNRAQQTPAQDAHDQMPSIFTQLEEAGRAAELDQAPSRRRFSDVDPQDGPAPSSFTFDVDERALAGLGQR